VTSLDKWGANMNTPVMKSLEDRNYWTKRIEKLMKALSSGSYTDETFDLLEIQLKQIHEMIRQNEPEQLPTPPGAGSEPTIKMPNYDKIVLIKNIYDGIRI
jgi:hypothetical protein